MAQFDKDLQPLTGGNPIISNPRSGGNPSPVDDGGWREVIDPGPGADNPPIADDGGQTVRDDSVGGGSDDDTMPDATEQKGYRLTNIANIAALVFVGYVVYTIYKGYQS